MNILSAALDQKKSLRPIQLGENGHVENAWSYNVDERICQFFFQLVRSKNHDDLRQKLNSMLSTLTWRDHRTQLTTLAKIMVQTRDIVSGKGEYDLAYMQIFEWYKFYPQFAFNCFKLFLDSSENPLDHQYGSWKDVKRMCQYIKDNSEDKENHIFIKGILSFSVNVLTDDYRKSMESPQYAPRLIGKWLPREKSKYGWIFKIMAKMLNPRFMDSATNRTSIIKASRKQKMYLKKILVYLNKRIDTVQIKMCDPNGKWSRIDFNKVTSLTISKSKNAILYVDKKGNVRGESKDRMQCRENYKAHLSQSMSGDTSKKIHGKRCQVGELVRDARKINIRESKCNDQANTINMQWESNKSNNKGLEGKSIVAMCDVSGSMECDNEIPINNAIGLSIRISELVDKSSGFKNRIMTFDSHPTWIQLDDNMSFVEKAHTVKNSAWGTSTDFYKALDNIIDVLVENEIPPSAVRQLIFAVFSDMQFDTYSHNINIFDTAEDTIKKKFVDAGMRTKWREPYEMPHILFWNLRMTTGFPATTFSKNITFLSGFSSTLLNVFCTQGIEALRETTPMNMLSDILNTDRYNIIEQLI